MALDKELQKELQDDLRNLQENINLIGAAYAFDTTHARDTAENIDVALKDAVKLINKHLDEISNYEIQAGNDVNDWKKVDSMFSAIYDTTNRLLDKVQTEIANYYDERGRNLQEFMKARQALLDSIQKVIVPKTIED